MVSADTFFSPHFVSVFLLVELYTFHLIPQEFLGMCGKQTKNSECKNSKSVPNLVDNYAPSMFN